MSDLHLGISQPNIAWNKCQTDTLVIAGDTTNSIGDTAEALKHIAKHFKNVILVDGNHEHYANANKRRTVDEATRRLSELLPENVHLLWSDRPSIAVEGVRFIGSMGWYVIHPTKVGHWAGVMNDDRWIGFGGRPQPTSLAQRDAGIVEYAIENSGDEPIVVVTHTAPCRDGIVWKPSDPGWDATNDYYFNPLMESVMERHQGRIAAWCYGHTHHRFDEIVHGTRIIANPRGYTRENPSWAPVEVEIAP